jgi:hypothetical protein
MLTTNGKMKIKTFVWILKRESSRSIFIHLPPGIGGQMPRRILSVTLFVIAARGSVSSQAPDAIIATHARASADIIVVLPTIAMCC